MILHTTFSFIVLICLIFNFFARVVFPIFVGWAAYEKYKADKIIINSLKVFNQETFSENYRKKYYNHQNTIQDQLAQNSVETINRAFKEKNNEW